MDMGVLESNPFEFPKIPNGYKNYFFIPMIFSNSDAKIIKIVAAHYNLSYSELKSQSRKREISYPRFIIMAFLFYNGLNSQLENKITFDKIGRFFNRDHSTVIYALKTIASDVKYNKLYAEQIHKVCNKLGINFEHFKQFLISYYEK